jgi:uncharacterized circularly permuted ATP-grasp superfamily protein
LAAPSFTEQRSDHDSGEVSEMRWPKDAVTRAAEREERETLERYLQQRTHPIDDVWVEAIGEASRRADAVIRLERRLRLPR